jgi:hypothetical protein
MLSTFPVEGVHSTCSTIKHPFSTIVDDYIWANMAKTFIAHMDRMLHEETLPLGHIMTLYLSYNNLC